MSAPDTTAPTGCIGYDVATALWQGNRPYQEDTLLADFHGGVDRGFAVLADGMGGHAAGDLASRLVVIDAVSHLKFLMHDGASLEANLHAELTSAITTANDVLKDRGRDDSRLSGMGTTFLATVMFEDRLYWASVGDSPLYLWREGALRQINADHSMAPVIDQMASAGEISVEDAANHPDRNALTSVLMGERIKSMDVPKVGMVLDPGDVLIQASDGLQYLDNAQISDVLSTVTAGTSSRDIADQLMEALHDLDDPLQDNTAILILQLCDGLGGGAVATRQSGADAGQAERVAGASVGATVVRTPHVAAAQAAPPLKPKQWMIPAVLLGGAVLVVGLYFGLPSEDADPIIAATQPPVQTTDPVRDPAALVDVAPADPNPVVAAIPAEPDDALAADVADPQAAPVQPDADLAQAAPDSDAAPSEDAAAPGEDQAEGAQPDTAPTATDVDVAAAETAPVNQGATIVFQNGGGATALDLGAGAAPIGNEAGHSGADDGASGSGIGVLGADTAAPLPNAPALPAPANPQAAVAVIQPSQDPAAPGVILGVGLLREGLEAPTLGTAPVELPERQRPRAQPDMIERNEAAHPSQNRINTGTMTEKQ